MHVALAVNPCPLCLHLLAELAQLILRKEHRHQLIAALPDLVSDLLKRNLAAVESHGILPGTRVQIHRIHQGTVNVENHCTWHSLNPLPASWWAWQPVPDPGAPPGCVH